jgi:hypothetical protein
MCSEERWRSEGIQVGGIRSARGVLGHWFDKYASLNILHMNAAHMFSHRDYDVHGPGNDLIPPLTLLSILTPSSWSNCVLENQ